MTAAEGGRSWATEVQILEFNYRLSELHAAPG